MNYLDLINSYVISPYINDESIKCVVSVEDHPTGALKLFGAGQINNRNGYTFEYLPSSDKFGCYDHETNKGYIWGTHLSIAQSSLFEDHNGYMWRYLGAVLLDIARRYKKCITLTYTHTNEYKNEVQVIDEDFFKNIPYIDFNCQNGYATYPASFEGERYF
ncbi:hypothetical protein WJW27_002776 [Escherichia coli]